jgi:hypothetical protein
LSDMALTFKTPLPAVLSCGRDKRVSIIVKNKVKEQM